ncbi:hypothetical protein IscW_ISCW024538 [Ixodes scapularis]|uniref:Uncharacterized protein n=1 Tax=Ixodes scapularis TaxID=6945 RepID=B7Q1E5_IXOSC|nr:hypothetical protein IscW_ISCW024538 [Ixodes scapularis]|eukprot:XP_002409584.1 hypothetical protein IscW_ISCW024538 [Ixodes scapularis]
MKTHAVFLLPRAKWIKILHAVISSSIFFVVLHQSTTSGTTAARHKTGVLIL